MSNQIDRRSFLKRSAVGGLAAAATGSTAAASATAADAVTADTKHARPHTGRRSAEQPNILVVIVDQLRYPRWFPGQSQLDAWFPNLARLQQKATVFENHHTASDMCVAARGTMVTGLYSQQTGCMLTGLTDTSCTYLSNQFPTWGTLLRTEGYETVWYGKWHLNESKAAEAAGGLEMYGFDGGTYPSPNGQPSQGTKSDGAIVDQFVTWYDANAAKRAPWCTTVSLVNPHDIAWWWNSTTVYEADALNAIDYSFGQTPPNYESLATLKANKPRLQTAYQNTMELILGPYQAQDGTGDSAWNKLLRCYVWFQMQVDAQIGRVLDTLESNPEVAANTVVIFTADHGEYGGSHGLRGKGGAVYEEALHVPLWIYDPRGRYSQGTSTSRSQLTSTVDLVPLLLSVATGGSAWRSEARYAHLAGRADIAAIAANPKHAGRPWVAHATDELAIEELSAQYSSTFDTSAPRHISAVITPAGKYARYSMWKDGTNQIESGDADFELYDYSTLAGQWETDNIAGQGSALESSLSGLLTSTVIPSEIRQPLPAALASAQEEGYASYYAIAGKNT